MHDDDEYFVWDPACPCTGHSGRNSEVERVQFSNDGRQLISLCSSKDAVIVWDFASGKRVRQLSGEMFVLVEGLVDGDKRDRHIITGDNDQLRIYEVAEEQALEQDGSASDPVATFKAPGYITSVRCHGSAICVGCSDGTVLLLSAPFLSA